MQEQIRFEKEGTTLTAYLCCELDHHHARGIREAIDHRLFVDKPTLLILDFSDVPFMDSSGVAFILGRAKTARTLGATVELVGLSRELCRLTRLIGADVCRNLTMQSQKGEL